MSTSIDVWRSDGRWGSLTNLSTVKSSLQVQELAITAIYLCGGSGNTLPSDCSWLRIRKHHHHHRQTYAYARLFYYKVY